MNMKNKMHYLKSVRKFLVVETCEILSLGLTNSQMLDDMEDSWFASLSDEDFGTVNNAINNRI